VGKYFVGIISVTLFMCLSESMAEAQTGNALYQQKNVSLNKEKLSDRIVENRFYAASVMETVLTETISGQVTDNSTGETLPGVNILVKGTSAGTSTDAEGQYELTVESLQDTLVVSYIGYQAKEVPIN